MNVDWCWACRRNHPMLDADEFAAVWRLFQERAAAERAERRTADAEQGTPRERLLRLQAEPRPEPRPETTGRTPRQVIFGPLQEAYEEVTGLRFDGDDPKVIMHYRASFYGPPCPYCGRRLRNVKARQCFERETDWHDPQNVVCRKRPSATGGPVAAPSEPGFHE